MGRLVFGLTGAFGSGCSFLADNYFVKEFGYRKYSLSDELRAQYLEKNGQPHKTRTDLQDFGNSIRETSIDALADAVYQKIEKDDTIDRENAIQKKIQYLPSSVVIDSIRNPAEIEFFRSKFNDFILIAVFADYDVRWTRVKEDYNNSKDTFDADEIRDQGTHEPSYGQKITSCFFQADVVISNNKQINPVHHNDVYSEMKQQLNNYILDFSAPTKSNPLIDETYMAMAYAIGRRSKCIRRRVGAVIVDDKMCVLSTGFNAVPIGLSDCEGKYGICYRQSKRGELKEVIHGRIKKNYPEVDSKVSEDIIGMVKVLDYCRSLHAEENAILGLVGRSFNSNLNNSTLYTTTYPCNLCANKIVQVGIKKVVYFEPYPIQEAKKIFEEANVEAKAFEGVTFRAFFRAFNYEE